MKAILQAVTVSERTFSKEVMKRYEDMVADSDIDYIKLTVSNTYQTAILEGLDRRSYTHRTLIVALNRTLVKKSKTDKAVQDSLISNLWQRLLKQHDIALILGVSQGFVSQRLKAAKNHKLI